MMKVGDYVRTKDYNGFPGGIAKIKEIRNDKKHKVNWLILDKALDHISFLEMSTNVAKSSTNIIDLIEVGDYVNGKLVSYIGSDCIEVYWYKDEMDWLEQEDIKSIVTREQFSQMEYKVGE